jgi:hypothetical protein
MLPFLSSELVLDCAALTRSTMLTVSASPTTRARWSSNKGRYCEAWKSAPFSGAGAAGAATTGGSRVSAISTRGALTVEHPPPAMAQARARTKDQPRPRPRHKCAGRPPVVWFMDVCMTLFLQ